MTAEQVGPEALEKIQEVQRDNDVHTGDGVQEGIMLY